MRQANFTLKTAWQCCLGLLLMLMVPLIGTAQTFTGTGNPQGIGSTDGGATTPSGLTTTSTATAMFTGGDIIGANVNIDNVTINLSHSWAGDVEIVLISPSGTRVMLSSDNGGSDSLDGPDDDDPAGCPCDLVFTDASSNDVTAWDGQAEPPAADYRAEGGDNVFPTSSDGPGVDLNVVFAGEVASGDWVLEIYDDAGGDDGVLNSYEITFASACTEALINRSFESNAGHDTGFNTDWFAFGAVFAIDQNSLGTAQDGDFYLKMFGGNSGVFQDQPVLPGEAINASVYIMNASFDPMLPGCVGFLKIEYFDGGGGFISAEESSQLDHTIPSDTWTQLTYSSIVPAGAATARFVAIMQCSAGGAVFFDNASMEVCPPPDPTDITFCVDLTCQADVPGRAAEAIAFDFNAFNSGPTPLTASGTNLYCGTFALPPGEVRYNFFFAGQAGAGGPEDLSGLNGAPCTSTVNGEVKRSYTVVEGVEETVTFVWESCDMSVVECFTAVTICADFSCESGYAAQRMVIDGVPGVTPLDMNAGNDVWCTTLNLSVGQEINYNFVYSGPGFDANEDLSGLAGEACVNTAGTRRVYTATDMPETVTYAWESCDSESDCSTTTDVTICADFSCETGYAAQRMVIDGVPGVTPLAMNAGTDVWCTTLTLDIGQEINYNFVYSGPGFDANEDLSGLAGEACVNAAGTRRVYTATDMPETVTYAWESCDSEADCDATVPITICGDFSCETGYAAQRMVIDGVPGVTPLDMNMMGDIWCAVIDVTVGETINYNFVYSGPGFDANEDLSGVTGDCVDAGRRTYTATDMPEMVTYAWESCEASTPCGANVEFCIDVSCWPDPVQSVNIFGEVNPGGFGNFPGPAMTDQGGGIYCTTLFLPEGDYAYKFVINNLAEAFRIDAGDCIRVTETGPPAFQTFTDRTITVVNGEDQNVLFGADSCTEECAPRAKTEFCVDIGCLPAGPVNVFGNFEPYNGQFFFFNPTATPMSDPDQDGIYCATVLLLPGEVRFKFLVDGVEETFMEGDPCTISEFGFTNRVTFVNGGEETTESYVFNRPCEDTFDEPTVEFPDLDALCDAGFTYTYTGGATPAGGVYSGTGITDNGDGLTFDVDLTGVDAGDIEVTYTLAGELECVYTASSTLTILDCGFAITDPCDCNDDSSPVIYDAATGIYDNPNDGTFSEVVSITAPVGAAGLPAGLDLRVVSSGGAFGVNPGDPLNYDGAGAYTIAFDHADDIGYTITVDQFIGGQAVGYNFQISNVCAYPNPIFDPELDAIYCSFEEAITLGADDLDGVGADDVVFTINGVPAMEFDPVALGPGIHEVVMSYDGADDGNGGVSPDGGTTPAFPGCNQDVITSVEVTDLDLGCIANLNVTLGDECAAVITPEMVLTGNFACADQVNVLVDGTNTDKIIGCGDHTYVIEVIVADELVYTCWGNVFAEDKTDPVIDCPDDTDNVTVEFDLQILEGSIDGTEDEIELDNYSCFQSFFEPAPGFVYNYDLITFTVDPDLPATDVYNIQTASNIPGLFLSLHQGSFNPDNPCENVLGGSEGAYFIDPFFGINAFFAQDFRIEMPLEPGQTYTLMVANTSFGSTGDYVVGIVSDNGGTFSSPFSAPSPVEVNLPLLCEDVDLIHFETPQSWIVSADGTLDFAATRDAFFGGSTAALNAFLEKLALGGVPVATDNCGPMVVTLSDEVEPAGDCGEITLTRTFSVADRYDGVCIGAPRTDVCEQVITFNRPTIFDLIMPPYTATLECDENFPTDGAVGGPDDNPAASVSGYPFLLTASGYMDLNETYCNLGANYSDEPRISECDGTYKLRREWNLIDWCNPADNTTWDQFVKVADYTGPVLTGVDEVINVSTSPFTCLANVAIPTPGISDGNGCSSVTLTTYTVLAFGESFFAGGNIADGDVVQAPIGEHVLILCGEDDCGNETCEEYDLNVSDEIEPTASCDDELNVSIGGGDIANTVEGIARIFAEDVNEGSNDNCGEVTLEVRRNYWRDNTCNPSANRWSPWGDYVDFYCCDIDNEITIELRVTDESGNSNICWLVVTPEDKLNPYCYAPENVELTCVDLPLAFPGDLEAAYDDDFAGTSTWMNAIFGAASGTDNCAVDTIVERTPNIQINECGWGSITRRFEAWQLRPEGDANGNGAIDINEVFRSTNSCSQLIVITEVHDFEIDFPEDAAADCGDPDVPTIITTTDGCDVLSVNIGDPVIFAATGDECYKYSVTYDVINWCLWDGEYTGYVIPRMTEDDGEALPIDRAVEGNERPVVRYNDEDGLCIDRRHNDRDGDSFLTNCGSPELDNYGRYIYTQFVKVYDSTAPVVTVGEFGGPTENCPDLLAGQFGDDDGDCEEPVSIPFSVTDECELFDGDGNLVISIVSAELDAFAVDANGDGFIKSNEFVADESVLGNITDNGDGTYSFDGTYPIITSAMGDNILHAIRILFEDGCGNQTSTYIEFDVIDCKGPAPVCINGLTVTLMPQEGGGCAMAIWASDFEGSPISDCTGQGPEEFLGKPRVTKYAIYRASTVEADPDFVPSPDDTGLILTQDDEETTVVYVYAFDEEGNYDYCETYVLVQTHNECMDGTGTIAGVIATENDETVEGVQVNVNGGEASMITSTDGTYNFSNLALGGDYTVTPYLNAEPLNGVSTFDLVLMSKHILGVQPLDSPYKRIAADVNRSESITTLDLIQLRKLILNITTEFENNTSWRFVSAAYDFPQVTNPWFELFPELINENDLANDVLDADFVGVKTGDVNGNAQANALAGDDRTLNGEFNFTLANESLVAGNVYTVSFRAADMDGVEGYQGTLRLNGAELVDIEYGVTTAENFGLRYADQGMITTSWNGEASADDVLFSLVIRATEDVELSAAVGVNSRYTAAEAYGNGNTMNVGVLFDNGEVASAGFEVYQNTPNPFRAETLIGFNLPQDAEATLTISDASGRVLNVTRGDYAAGYNTLNVTKEMIQGASGVLSYTITAGEFTATKKMIAVK